MKQTAVTLFFVLLAVAATAQDDPESFRKYQQQMREQFERERDKMNNQYDDFRRKAEADYAAFRKKANEEYAAAVAETWQQMGVQPAVPKPVEPKPPQPRKPAPDRIPSSHPLPQGETVPPPAKLPPVPLPPIPVAPPATPTLRFDFYGASCGVHADKGELRFRLSSLEEKSLAAAWKTLSQEKYDGLLHDCLAQRETLHLGDWGYLQMLQTVAENLLGKGSNEAVLLQMYLFAQSGYRVRLAHDGNRLMLLVPFNHGIYQYSFINIDSFHHYLLTKDKPRNGLYVCQVGLPREQVASIQLSELPKLGDTPWPMRSLSAERYPSMEADVEVDKDLVDFLNDYPLSDACDYYALTGLSEKVKASLYPTLRKQLEGKGKRVAADMLLDFVQTAFEYATDQEQFGYERPMFGDESFYYPKNDCEDRSILYSILVRDLLGLEVVLVYWPNHLATAVCFNEEVDGDYFTIDGRRYTVCDPTYIGATIGETMPQFQGVEARLVRL